MRVDLFIQMILRLANFLYQRHELLPLFVLLVDTTKRFALTDPLLIYQARVMYRQYSYLHSRYYEKQQLLFFDFSFPAQSVMLTWLVRQSVKRSSCIAITVLASIFKTKL